MTDVNLDFTKLRYWKREFVGEFGIKFWYWKLDENGKMLAPVQNHHLAILPEQELPQGLPEKETAIVNAVRIGYEKPVEPDLA